MFPFRVAEPCQGGDPQCIDWFVALPSSTEGKRRWHRNGAHPTVGYDFRHGFSHGNSPCGLRRGRKWLPAEPENPGQPLAVSPIGRLCPFDKVWQFGRVGSRYRKSSTRFGASPKSTPSPSKKGTARGSGLPFAVSFRAPRRYVGGVATPGGQSISADRLRDDSAGSIPSPRFASASTPNCTRIEKSIAACVEPRHVARSAVHWRTIISPDR